MKCWVAVASAEHVRRGRAGGFMQVSHGKAAPMRRVRGGDQVVYYSPTEALGGKDALRSFTAIGAVLSGELYQVDMGGIFRPFRRDVHWVDALESPIAPLIDELEFTSNRRNWGYQLRFGLLEISVHDMRLIAFSMGVQQPFYESVRHAKSTTAA
jgi:hypothetical protein